MDSLSEWPNLLNEISKRDLRAASRYLLPPGVYDGARPIIDLMDVLETLSFELKEQRQMIDIRARMPESERGEFGEDSKRKFAELYEELVDKQTALRGMADQYREKVIAEFEATYQ